MTTVLHMHADICVDIDKIIDKFEIQKIIGWTYLSKILNRFTKPVNYICERKFFTVVKGIIGPKREAS